MRFKHGKRTHSAAEILKVQLPLASTMVTPQALVYNRDRSHMGHIDVTPELKTILGGEVKSFWYGWLEGTSLTLYRKAPWKEW